MSSLSICGGELNEFFPRNSSSITISAGMCWLSAQASNFVDQFAFLSPALLGACEFCLLEIGLKPSVPGTDTRKCGLEACTLFSCDVKLIVVASDVRVHVLLDLMK